MSYRRVLVLVMCAVGGGCGDVHLDLEAERASLLEADRAFARATAERGTEGWVGYFDDGGMMLPQGGSLTRGVEAIRSLMEPAFASEGFSLSWEPLEAVVCSSGDLGYTLGRYRRTYLDAESGTQSSVGKYVTVWKKQPDGSWKVALDIGNEGAP